MPPRSVCLNVFTTSLSTKEASVSVREFDNGDVKEKPGRAGERARHDSLQSSSSDTISTPPYSNSVTTSAHTSPTGTTNIDISSFPVGMGGLVSRPVTNKSLSATTPFPPKVSTSSRCATCGQIPGTGNSLQRCSRCKSVYYCSKTCQKAGWKLHKNDCGSASAIGTPNISMPGSPTDLTASAVYQHGNSDVAMTEASPVNELVL